VRPILSFKAFNLLLCNLTSQAHSPAADNLQRRSKLVVFFDLKEVSHGMHQAIVCHRLRRLRGASVVEYRNTQCARRRSCLSHFRGRPDGQTAMHKHLSCTLSRLSSSEPVTIVRMSGCLPGLHPIHLYWFRTRMTDVPCAAVSDDALAVDIALE
jgi:hypothetical protein